MVGHSQDQLPHDDNEDLSSIYSRPSIQNSPDWHSVRLPSPGPSVRTLNEPDDRMYLDDISSLANFSCGDLDSSDRGSVFTTNISTSPSDSRSSTPSSSSHDQYDQSPSYENSNSGASGVGRSRGFMPLSPSTRADGRQDQSGLPHLVQSLRKSTVGSTRSTIGSTSEFKHDSRYHGISSLVDSFNNDLPQRSVFTDIIPVSARPSTPKGGAGGGNEYASEGHQPVGPNVTAMFCRTCGLPMAGAFIRALGAIFHLQCFKCIDCGDVVASKFFPIDDPDGKQQPLCERDYFRRLDLICANCSCALRGSYITACNKKYHVEHFTCTLCPTLFGPQDSYYEYGDDVYCHYHYSTRFAVKCFGCSTAILKQYVEINRNRRDECWHPECYMIHKYWNVRVAPRLPRGFTDTIEPPYVEVERQESHVSLKEKQIRMEQQVYRIWTVLSAYEESCAASISNMLRHISSGLYLESIRMAERAILYVEVLFATIDDLEWHFAQLRVRGISHVRESRMLCRKLRDLFVLLSRTQDTGAGRLGMTQELMTLVTGIAHYLKLLIRITLTSALKLGRDHGLGVALLSFLDKLHMLAEQKGSPSARRMTAGAKDDVPLSQRSPSINTSTYGVTYGFRSLAPEIAGESPFLDASRDFALSNVQVPSPPRDTCVACARTIEEDCVRLGTYQRWHSRCVRCAICGVDAAPAATADSKDKALVKSWRGAGDGSVAPVISTARRPPANVDLFVWSPVSIKSTRSYGAVPTTIYCTDHAHSGCREGFQTVSRLEQNVFLLNVALRRLHLLLKEKNIITPIPTNTASLTSGETDPSHSSQDVTRMKSDHLDRKLRKLPATARIPKGLPAVESPSGKVAYPGVANMPKGNPSRILPPEPTPADLPRPEETENTLRQRRGLPPLSPLELPTLPDIPQSAEATQTTEQGLSVPPQNLAPYVAELSSRELEIVRHAAVAVLYRSSLRDKMDLDQVLELFEVKRQRFWGKLFKGGNDRKKKGVLGVPLELLVEREGVDSLLGASGTTLKVPWFVDGMISAMRQMDMAIDFRKGSRDRRRKGFISAFDRDPYSVIFAQERPEEMVYLLTKFLRELPDPLLTLKLQGLFIATAGLPNDEERKRLLHMLTLVLPKCHRDTLEVLLVFLKRLSSFAKDDFGTRLDLSTLACVICPGMLFPGSQVYITDFLPIGGPIPNVNEDRWKDDKYAYGIKAVTELLENQDQFFTIPEEFLPLLEFFAGGREISSRDFLKQCEMYMRIKFDGPATESVRIRGTIAERQR